MSHAAGGDGLPPWLNVLVALVLALPVCVFLAGRALSWFRLAVAVSISQLLFHALLSVPLGVSGAPAPAHDHHAMGSSMLSSIGWWPFRCRITRSRTGRCGSRMLSPR